MRLAAFVALVFTMPVSADPSATAVKVTQAKPPFINSGSGTVVESRDGQSLVLTNRHVLPSPDGKIKVHVGNEAYPAEWLGVDETADLAIVVVKAKLPVAPIAKEVPPVGAEVRQWGFAGGNGVRPKQGTAGQLSPQGDRTAEGAKIYYTSIIPEQGDSGCGVFDSEGRLIAVNWGGNRNECCVGLADVKRFVAKYAGKDSKVMPQAKQIPKTIGE